MKTYNQFLNTPFSEEVKPPEPQEEDPGIKSKQKRQMQIKKQVLLKKMQAVRAGAGADIVASHTPEGEVIDEKKKGLDGKECWDGYKLAGTKKKDGKTVDNCVKVKEDYYRGTGEKVVARTKKWMDKKGQKGAPGLDAMKARTAEHKAKRGVKEEVVDEGVYEKQKTKEVMGALKKRDLKTSVKKKIAADIVKKKGDTSKSDDRLSLIHI